MRQSPDQRTFVIVELRLRQSPDHRTFVIVGAKVANKSLFWSHMAVFWGDLFLGSLWLHFIEYGV